MRARALAVRLPIGIGLSLAAAAGAASGSCARDEHRVEVRQGDCFGCHEEHYAATAEPPHADLFGTTCADCHTTLAWIPAQAIVHDWFPIRNAHAPLRCGQCHTVGYRPGDTPASCVGCHDADYERAHQRAYPMTCADCHDDVAWRPSTFVHPWRLDGAHVTQPCSSCHVGDPPVFAGTPSQCVDCHRDDWDRAVMRADISHATFPMACASCHTTGAWTPALNGAHPEATFPIAAGAHAPFGCTDCHDPSLGSSVDGMNTDCVGCHTGEHTRASADADHGDVAGYPSGPAAPNFCLDCHPDGRN